jgi:hypothetical protein
MNDDREKCRRGSALSCVHPFGQKCIYQREGKVLYCRNISDPEHFHYPCTCARDCFNKGRFYILK